jgi:hypothetical protein
VAFDIEHIAQRFYARFRQEHAIFASFIQGITSQSDRERYAWLMLNRLMFVYFLQKKGLLDDNVNYLRDKLSTVQKNIGKDMFCYFYRYLLFRLFHEGSEKQEQGPVAKLDALIGDVPFLHGDLFEVHAVAQLDNSNIYIPDEAFSKIFAFLDTYHWHISKQPLHHNEINPDVIGCIFEKYISQKAMGVYYTTEDITSYIGKHTIMPYIFNTVQQSFPMAFATHSPLWNFFQAHLDSYLPSTILNEEYLPAETEREYQYRRARREQIRAELATRAYIDYRDFITYNLNADRFIRDTIRQCTDSSLLRSFYETIAQITILDPTCGSGAFLFTALNMLEPLYTACLERIQSFLDTNKYKRRKKQQIYHLDKADKDYFQTLLKRVNQYASRSYFILQSIATNNLYGVDIMPEAIEICKLRLFLKLVGQLPDKTAIGALPDVDFNIRQGNALVFHWPIEFYSVMQRGGFDVIIGNPPYVEYKKVCREYKVPGYESRSYGNLYAVILERSLQLARPGWSHLGLIVPLSICGSERFKELRQTIKQQVQACWLANFEIFPCSLFHGPYQRLSIFLARHGSNPIPTFNVTGKQRWYAQERPHLLDLISYNRVECSDVTEHIPKLASPLQEYILDKITHKAHGNHVAQALSQQKTEYFVYYQEATNYWIKATCSVPYYKKNGIVMTPAHGRSLYFNDRQTAQTIMALLNSSLFYVWFATYSDGFHLSHALVKAFPVDMGLYALPELQALATQLHQDIRNHAHMSTRNTRANADKPRASHQIELEEYHLHYAKSIIDEIDRVLARHYGFSDDELDFIINYEIKYRLGQRQAERHDHRRSAGKPVHEPPQGR